MTRSLKHAVVAGGVVYPAGTAATPELEKRIPAKHWVGEPTSASSSEDAPKAPRKRAAPKKTKDPEGD